MLIHGQASQPKPRLQDTPANVVRPRLLIDMNNPEGYWARY